MFSGRTTCTTSPSSSSSLAVHHRLLLDFTAQQVARVCQTLDDSGNLDRLARFLWSLPDDPLSRDAFDRHESVLIARAVVAYNTGQFNELYRILSSYRSVFFYDMAFNAMTILNFVSRYKICEFDCVFAVCLAWSSDRRTSKS
jgi:Transcriptional regulator, SIX1, N-terminal SD domain